MKCIQVESKNIVMEIDTGSAISCISYDFYKSKFYGLPLLRTNVVLSFYSGARIAPLGKIVPNVKFRDKCLPLDLFVVERGHHPLMGRQWIYELGLNASDLNCIFF